MRFALVGLVSLLGLAQAAPAAPQLERAFSTSCSDLWTIAPQHLSNLTVYVAEHVAKGSTFNDTTGFTAIQYNMPELCRFGAYIHTPGGNKVKFEVWMPPIKNWNGRFAMVGNGADAGYVYYHTMTTPLGRYGFAVASTDTGHTGNVGDGTFAINNPESQIDFGHRAVHLTAVYSKAIVKAYYGQASKYNYWIGCSSGGKQGYKEAQAYPEDFDGVLAGAAAAYWSHLNGYQQHVNMVNNISDPTVYLNPSIFGFINQEVMHQCDALDGIKDGIIVNPRKCHVDVKPLQCGHLRDGSALNETTCLSSAQAKTLQHVWANYTFSDTGKLIFPGFEPGSEYAWSTSVTGVPFGPAPSYYAYQVLNVSHVVYPIDSPTLNVTESELQKLIHIADKTDPGQTIAWNPDLKPFFKRGGRLLTYHGFADTLIPSGSSIWYWQSVQDTLGDTSDHFRLFMVPGMGHCTSGPGAFNFGQASQLWKTENNLQSAKFDPEHDAILALIRWTEKGVAPKTLTGVAYNGANSTQGVAFERLFCPWPKQAEYVGGNVNASSSYTCR